MNKAILVGAYFQNETHIDYYMQELASLAEANDIEVLYEITQTIHRVTPAFYIGSGKVEEIKKFKNNLDADLIIFNNELSGSQIRNLEEAIDCRVIDRTLLILDIFASRAKTKEAMLQVEIAQLEYMFPRLVGLKNSLNRQQGGIGSRGPGEKQLELDRRKIEYEISKLKKELEEIVKSRHIQRRNRNKSAIKKLAIVGYTNAGKSTLLNGLMLATEKEDAKEVLQKDMLFATLDTSTRLIKLQSNKSFLATDTVGFVSNLPHHLVESFKSTLEEITEADYILHVVDSTNEYHENQIEVTNNTLEDIGVHDIPVLYVYNKMDLVNEEITINHYPNIEISSIDVIDVALLLQKIESELFKDYEEVTLLVPFNEGEIVSDLNMSNNVIKQEYINEGTLITLELSPIQIGKYKTYIKNGSRHE